MIKLILSHCQKLKEKLRVARRVYVSTYANIDKIDEIENDFRANGNGLLSVRQTKSATELFGSFRMFYCINGRLPNTDVHLFVPDGETPRIIGEKLSLKKSSLQKILGKVQTVLFCLHFLLPCYCV